MPSVAPLWFGDIVGNRGDVVFVMGSNIGSCGVFGVSWWGGGRALKGFRLFGRVEARARSLLDCFDEGALWFL